MTLAEHVVLRALALGFPNGKVLYVTLAEHVSLWVLALVSLAGRSDT